MYKNLFHLFCFIILVNNLSVSCKTRTTTDLKTTNQIIQRSFVVNKFKWVQEPIFNSSDNNQISLIVVLRPQIYKLSSDTTLEQIRKNPDMIKIKAQCIIEDLKQNWQNFMQNHPQLQCLFNEIKNLVLKINKQQQNTIVLNNILYPESNLIFILDASSITDRLFELEDLKRKSHIIRASVKALIINKIFNEMKILTQELQGRFSPDLYSKLSFGIDPYGQGVKDSKDSLISIQEDISLYPVLLFVAITYQEILVLYPKLPGIVLVNNFQKIFGSLFNSLGSLAH